MKAPHRPIPTRQELLPPKGIEKVAVEAWVRRWTKRRVRLDDEFDISGPGDSDSRKQRAKLLKFARVLQTELLHFENWGGTPRS